MRILDEDIYRTVERHLYNYSKLKREIDQQREDILHGRPSGSETMGRASVRADPTAQKAVAREAVKGNPWLDVITCICGSYGHSRRGRLLRMCYFEGQKRDMICAELDIDRTTYYDWKAELVVNVALTAATRGLLTKKT